MKSIGPVAVGAGFFFVTVAMFVQGFLPMMIPESRSTQVTRAVRTDLGDVKWLRYDASDYTPLERRGRSVYIREGCWYCHSQYVRPVAGENQRWGPVSEAGEYAFDLPHLLSTRRIGPDLARVGLKYGDDWHYAHHWDPRFVVPDSVMPGFKWLYSQIRLPLVKTADGPALPPAQVLRLFFTMKAGKLIPLYPNAGGLTFVSPPPEGRWPLDGTPTIDFKAFGSEPPALRAVTLIIPTRDMIGLVAYLQKLGTDRGAWREVFEPQMGVPAVPAVDTAPAQGLTERGRVVYKTRCIGCHGPKGDGNGVAATFLFPRPRDFTLGVFKFRTTPSGSLPTDRDLFRTVTRGVRWTAMPTWHELPAEQRLAVVTYIKTFSTRWKDEKPEPPAEIGDPPRATPALVERGRTLYQSAKCAQCHGQEGKGDGESASDLTDDLKFAIRPTDFTRGQLKGGSTVRDVYRTMTLGLDGTPMPSFADALSDEERWALAYYILSLSAWRDPLTGRPLTVPADARAALDSPDTPADRPETALDPARLGRAAVESAQKPGTPRVYPRGIRE